MTKKIIVFLTAIILISCFSSPVFALTLPNPNDSVSINNDSIQITQAGTYTITGTGLTTNTILVDPDIVGDVNITLNEVNINVGTTPNACAFLIGSNTNVILTITGTNILTSGLNSAGLCVPPGASININGTGSLNATGGGNINGGGAGIGGYIGLSSGKITISSGTIIATGGHTAAGIGGGTRGTGDVTIKGGTVTATSGEDGAGIGGGKYANGGTITILGGTITAKSIEGGAGIGCGYNLSSNLTTSNGGNIILSGGIITAVGGSGAAGIGGGQDSMGGNILINGNVKITATGGFEAAGIGGGKYGNSGDISINDTANVIAFGGTYGAGIGGFYDEDKKITINGGFIQATGGNSGAGIGGADQCRGNVTINGGIVHAKGGETAAGIGGGYYASATININGGEVYAEAGAIDINDINGTRAEDIGMGSNSLDIAYVTISAPSAVFTMTPQNLTITKTIWMNSTIYCHVTSTSALGYNNFPESWFDQHIGAITPMDIPTYTVTFNSEGGSFVDNQTITYNNILPKPEDPIRATFTFDGWFKTIELDYFSKWDFENELVTQETTLFAKWIEAPVIRTFPVIFSTGSGSIINSQLVNENEKVIRPSNPTQTDYTFDGWFTSMEFNDDDRWNFNACQIIENTTLYAKWTAVPVINTFSVIFNTGSGSIIETQSVIQGEHAIKPSNPTQTDYIFDGWFTSMEFNDDDRWNFDACLVIENTNLYAKWNNIATINSYNITFDTASGSAVNSQTILDNEKAVKPANPTQTGYTFDGWYTSINYNNDNQWNFNLCPVTQSMTLYAKWTLIPQVAFHTITFDSQNGSEISKQTSYNGTKISEPINPTRDNYIFDGWYTSNTYNDNEKWNFNLCTITKNITLYAKWTAITPTITYTINFESKNGSAIDSQVIDARSKVIKPSEPVRNNYNFLGWYANSNFTNDSQWNFNYCTVTKNMTLYAKWIAIPQKTTYTVDFDSQNGSIVNKQVISDGSNVIKPSSPIRDTYTFDGWFTDVDCTSDHQWNFSICPIKQDTILYAKWLPQLSTYAISFDSNNDTLINVQTIKSGGNSIEPINPTRSGYSFDGWYTSKNYSNNTKWNFTYCIVSEDITLYAKWIEKIPSPSPSPIDDTKKPSASSSPDNIIIPTHILKNNETGILGIELEINIFSADAKAIKIPDGRIIELNDAKTIKLDIQQINLDDTGMLNIITLDANNTQLDSYVVQLENVSDSTMDLDIDDNENDKNSIPLWEIAFFISLLLIGVLLFYIFKLKKKS